MPFFRLTKQTIKNVADTTFNLRNNSYHVKLERRPQMLVKLGFRELGDSKLSGLRTNDMDIS